MQSTKKLKTVKECSKIQESSWTWLKWLKNINWNLPNFHMPCICTLNFFLLWIIYFDILKLLACCYWPLMKGIGYIWLIFSSYIIHREILFGNPQFNSPIYEGILVLLYASSGKSEYACYCTKWWSIFYQVLYHSLKQTFKSGSGCFWKGENIIK